jgi:hypothetical protein
MEAQFWPARFPGVTRKASSLSSWTVERNRGILISHGTDSSGNARL